MMTQLGQVPTDQNGKAPNNVYTVLALIAVVALLAGIIFVWLQSARLFGTSHPFQVLVS